MEAAAEAHALEVASLAAELSLAAAALQRAERRHAAAIGLMATKDGQRRKDVDERLAKMSDELAAASAAQDEARIAALLEPSPSPTPTRLATPESQDRGGLASKTAKARMERSENRVLTPKLEKVVEKAPGAAPAEPGTTQMGRIRRAGEQPAA